MRCATAWRSAVVGGPTCCHSPVSQPRHIIHIGLPLHPLLSSFSSTDTFSQRSSSLLIYPKYLQLSGQKLINRHTACKLITGKWSFVVAWEGLSGFSQDSKMVWRKGLCKASLDREVRGGKGEGNIAPSPEQVNMAPSTKHGLQHQALYVVPQVSLWLNKHYNSWNTLRSKRETIRIGGKSNCFWPIVNGLLWALHLWLLF